jgi:LPS sulfotransferase NodH
MTGAFDYFVIFAEMRTGSNFLESNLNALGDLRCYGEAFNPHFIGYPNSTDILGVTQAAREEDPERLIDAIKEGTDGLGGFRFFHDHDARALDLCLADRRCAKIILTRNPLDSYVSWKIAQATGQWKLTNVKRRRDHRAVFDMAEFSDHVARLQAFQIHLLNRLQTSGQTAFYVAYEDLQDVAVMNGLARYLGSAERLDKLDGSLKKQNPAAPSEKVENFDEMARALSGLDSFNLTRTPNFEPRRGAGVPGYVTGAETPLLYMPVRSGPEAEICRWLAALDGVAPGDLPTKFNQKDLRQWKRRNKGHRSFTVLRHPLARAHAVFCERILPRGPGTFADIRKTLRNCGTSTSCRCRAAAPAPDGTATRIAGPSWRSWGSCAPTSPARRVSASMLTGPRRRRRWKAWRRSRSRTGSCARRRWPTTCPGWPAPSGMAARPCRPRCSRTRRSRWPTSTTTRWKRWPPRSISATTSCSGSTVGAEAGSGRLNGLRLCQDGVQGRRVPVGAQLGAERTVPQRARDQRQRLEVFHPGIVGRQQREDEIDGLTIHGIEIDGFFQKHHRPDDLGDV